MFGKKNWVNKLCIEGEKEAQLVARMENLPEANPEFDHYPVDIKLPERRTLKEAVKKSIEYGEKNIYNMIYRVTKKEG